MAEDDEYSAVRRMTAEREEKRERERVKLPYKRTGAEAQYARESARRNREKEVLTEIFARGSKLDEHKYENMPREEFELRRRLDGSKRFMRAAFSTLQRISASVFGSATVVKSIDDIVSLFQKTGIAESEEDARKIIDYLNEQYLSIGYYVDENGKLRENYHSRIIFKEEERETPDGEKKKYIKIELEK